MLDERAKLIAYCPFCSTRTVQVDAQVLGGERDVQLTHVTCRRCAASMLTLSHVGQGSAGAIGLVTDLSAQDTVSFAHSSAISSDDVLLMHKRLTSPISTWLPAASVPMETPARSRGGDRALAQGRTKPGRTRGKPRR